MSSRDQKNLADIQRNEKILHRQSSRLLDSYSGCNRIWVALKPFMFLFGILFLLISLLIVISILLTNVDKAVNSHKFCGAKCGFVIAYPKVFNPLNTALTTLSQYFPLDYILLGVLIFYIFLSTLSGIVKIGVRFLWVHLYAIKKGGTAPQGLLVASIILMLTTLCLNMEITTLAPQYANFGSQVYVNSTTGKTSECSLDAPTGLCTMTQIGTFVNHIAITTNFFGIVFFYATWVFIAAFGIGTLIAVFKPKAGNLEQRDSDSDSDGE